jgi:hypothetical protein
MFNEQIHSKSPFSIAMLVDHRVLMQLSESCESCGQLGTIPRFTIIHHSHIHVAESDREPLMISHPNENHTMKDIK